MITAVGFVVPGFITNFCPGTAAAKNRIQEQINLLTLYSGRKLV
jgi:hypothetical protein